MKTMEGSVEELCMKIYEYGYTDLSTHVTLARQLQQFAPGNLSTIWMINADRKIVKISVKIKLESNII